LLQAELYTAKQEVAKLEATKASTTTPATTSDGEGGKATPAKTTPTGARLPNKDKITEVVKTINKNKVIVRDSNDNVEKEI
jgi:hypothetical protein